VIGGHPTPPTHQETHTKQDTSVSNWWGFCLELPRREEEEEEEEEEEGLFNSGAGGVGRKREKLREGVNAYISKFTDQKLVYI
jgi:hypothetical protein